MSDPENQFELCHTPEECRATYEAISAETKAPALALLAETLQPIAADIRLAYVTQPTEWHKSRLMGIALRNLLRSRGFGESHFGVHNLDDIYLLLIEDALKLKM